MRTRTTSAAPSAHLAVIGLIAVMSLGLVAYAIKIGTPLRYEDERQYVEIAMSLRNGQGFELYGSSTAYRPPVWPMVVAVFLALGLPGSLLSVIPACAMIAAAVVAAVLGVKLSRSSWGALAGVAVLAYPLNIYTAVRLYPQAFATLLVVTLWLVALLITEDGAEAQDAEPSITSSLDWSHLCSHFPFRRSPSQDWPLSRGWYS